MTDPDFTEHKRKRNELFASFHLAALSLCVLSLWTTNQIKTSSLFSSAIAEPLSTVSSTFHTEVSRKASPVSHLSVPYRFGCGRWWSSESSESSERLRSSDCAFGAVFQVGLRQSLPIFLLCFFRTTAIRRFDGRACHTYRQPISNFVNPPAVPFDRPFLRIFEVSNEAIRVATIDIYAGNKEGR